MHVCGFGTVKFEEIHRKGINKATMRDPKNCDASGLPSCSVAAIHAAGPEGEAGCGPAKCFSGPVGTVKGMSVGLFDVSVLRKWLVFLPLPPPEAPKKGA